MFSDLSQVPGDNAAAVYIPCFDDLYVISPVTAYLARL